MLHSAAPALMLFKDLFCLDPTPFFMIDFGEVVREAAPEEAAADLFEFVTANLDR